MVWINLSFAKLNIFIKYKQILGSSEDDRSHTSGILV